MKYTEDISIVISLFNEAESLPELIRWIEVVMTREGYTYEIIMTDDGSTDSSWKIIKEAAQRNHS
ncbi:MAG: glycosyltransferase, partial [Bacteroidales bacterium]|nr:glycosyltransferase [Bacteroidales bacterium]